MESTNLKLTVDLATDKSDEANDVPAHLNAANENFKKIDEFAGKIANVSGTFTVPVNVWTAENQYSLSIEELGAKDLITLIPATVTDRNVAEAAHLFAQAGSKSITLSADILPTADLTFNYFITRGK